MPPKTKTAAFIPTRANRRRLARPLLPSSRPPLGETPPSTISRTVLAQPGASISAVT
jgi:hypothetical protein